MANALIIVDVQNDFCEGGSLAVAGGASVAGDISALLASRASGSAALLASRASGSATAPPTQEYEHVVATKDHHVEPGDHFHPEPDFVSTWPEHCVVGTPGAEFHPALDTDQIEAVFEKGHHAAAYSGFEGKSGGIPLSAWLRMREVTDVDIVGIATDHCVRATALDAVREGFTTTVRLDLTAGVARSTTDAALAELTGAGVRLVGSPTVAAGAP